MFMNWERRVCRLLLLAVVLITSSPSFTHGQGIGAVGGQIVSGEVASITNHSMELKLYDGSLREVFFQDRGIDAIMLGGNKAMARVPATISVTGELKVSALRKDLALEADVDLDKGGSVKELHALKLLPIDFDEYSVEWQEGEPSGSSTAKLIARGQIVRLANSKIYLKVPKGPGLSKGGIIIPVTAETTFSVNDDSMHEVAIGDRIVDTEVIKFNTGDWIARKLNVELSDQHDSVQSDPDDFLEIKYRHLNNDPQSPREIRSQHFILKTDLSDRSSQILLDKLETMFRIVGKYYNRRSLNQPIFCYVADDLDLWKDSLPELAPGLESIVGEAGVTVSRVGARASCVYSCGKHDVVQHESVHAFCHLAFGSVGPTWYAEGMAELGCYWRPGDVGVNIDPVVIRYLTSSEPTPLVQIVAPGQITGDSWQAYAWRWALCYMLVNNPNYAQRFYGLGDAMMRPNSRANFYNEFSDVAPEISFEYRQFTREMGNGYQQELCSWDWKTKFVGLDTGRTAKAKVEAKRGWQATSAKLKKDQRYEAFARGSWSIDGTTEIDPDGDSDGEGQLIGAILYEKANLELGTREIFLSEPFELGTKAEFTASHDGQLYVRTKEKMTRLGDNRGQIEFAIREQK